jgi:molecular chaperone DnaK
VYSSEKTMAEHGDKVSPEAKADIEEKIEALKSAIAAQNAVDMQSREQELSSAIQKVGEAIYASTSTPPASADGSGGEDIPPAGGGEESSGSGDDGDVVDAEFKEV